MPGKVKVKIVAGRNLPVMDRSSDTTDAYVEIKLGNTTFKTDVCRKSLNPQWNSEWYRFEMDDAELQDEPLQIRLMDHDTYSANDAIGKVYLDLNPLLLPPSSTATKTVPDTGPASSVSLSGGSTMSGWFPVYDTMHGIRGEVNVIVKVELFSDFNKFRQSSCGVQFFNSSVVPQGHHAQTILGLVEELVVDDDPEYQWIDKIRTPRASNEARQTLFFKLSGEVQRRIGLKVLDLGGNAVIGYLQCFDLEGESGIVVRGIGTAVTLIKLHDHTQPPPTISCDDRSDSGLAEPWQSTAPPCRVILEDVQPTTSKNSQSPAKLNSVQGIHRRSSDSDLSITPKGNSLTSSDRSSLAGGVGRVFHGMFHRPMMYKETLDMLEYPFLTMSKYPQGFIVHLGGTVSARSVKLLERITNLEEPESRDSWWTELRMEVRSHARALACNVVLGYNEHSAICDDVCVLSASGTAAVISVRSEGGVLNLSGNAPTLSETPEPVTSMVTKQLGNMTTSLDRSEFERQGSLPQTAPLKPDSGGGGENVVKPRHTSENGDQPPESPLPPCAVCHIPYNVSSVPFSVTITKCAICRRGKVSDVLLTTIEPPENIPVAGRCCLLQAFVCRPKRDGRGEMNAKDISDGLPFLEYELHSQLINKLKVNGMNAIFRLRTQICLGERMIAALATGTAVLLAALPIPPVPTVTAGNAWKDEAKLSEIQKQLQDTIKKNREYYLMKTTLNTSQEGDPSTKGRTSDTEDSDDDLPDVDLTTGTKDTCILEVDDAEDANVISQLIDPHPPDGFHVMASEHIPGLEDLEVVKNLQMFTQVWRSRIPPTVQMSSLNKNFHRLLQGVYFKLRRMTPCAIGNIRFRVELPEPDEVQISLVGMALGLGEVDKSRPLRRKVIVQPGSKDFGKKSDEADMIFCLEEDQESNGSNLVINKPVRPRSPILVRAPRKSNHVSSKEHYGVDITPLTFIPGGKIDRYLGNLNFFFIRESSCIREGGGLSGFVHSFVAEVLAIVRAHVTALGGNAMVAYFMNECILLNNPHKNHGQCLVNIGGDAVFVTYPMSE